MELVFPPNHIPLFGDDKQRHLQIFPVEYQTGRPYRHMYGTIMYDHYL